MHRWRRLLLFAAACTVASCGEVEYVEACKNAESAAECEECCEAEGFFDWSYNADYSPPCGCIE